MFLENTTNKQLYSVECVAVCDARIKTQHVGVKVWDDSKGAWATSGSLIVNY